VLVIALGVFVCFCDDTFCKAREGCDAMMMMIMGWIERDDDGGV
jgi:hypothetical protein